MKRSLVRTTFAALAVLGAAGTASAQEPADTTPKPRRATVHLLPTVSSMDVDIRGRNGSAVSAAGETRVYGLAVEVATPLRGVDLRLGMSTSRPLLNVDRGPGAPAEVGRARLNTFTLDAVVHGPRLLGFRPYAVVGTGYRYYDFTEGGYFEGISTSHGAFLAHVGAGAAWEVGRYELTLEAGRHYNRVLDNERLQDGSARSGTLTVGLRIPVH